MRRIALIFMLFATSVQAGDWVPQNADNINSALSGKILQYENAWQEFSPPAGPSTTLVRTVGGIGKPVAHNIAANGLRPMGGPVTMFTGKEIASNLSVKAARKRLAPIASKDCRTGPPQTMGYSMVQGAKEYIS